MSERLAHWDDYLLASVMIHCSDIYQCYAVIAAVEDWQEQHARDRRRMLRCPSRDGAYDCTRETGHDGPHRAEVVVAQWDSDQDGDSDD